MWSLLGGNEKGHVSSQNLFNFLLAVLNIAEGYVNNNEKVSSTGLWASSSLSPTAAAGS